MDKVARWDGALGRALLEGGPWAVGVFDAELRHVAVNERLAAMNGLSPAQLVGRTPVEVHGPAVADAEAMYARVMRDGEPVLGQAFAAALPGHPDFVRHWLLNVLPLTDPAGVVVVVEEVTDQVAAETARDHAMAELEHLAVSDPLTGVLNRRGLEQATRGLRGDHVLAFVDLDGFKAVNDLLGHEEGDRVLAGIAKAIAEVLAAGEVLARVGGDEFVVVGSRPDVAARVRAAVASVDVPTAAGLSASVGTTRHDPAVEPVGDAIRRADRAMYATRHRRDPPPPSR